MRLPWVSREAYEQLVEQLAWLRGELYGARNEVKELTHILASKPAHAQIVGVPTRSNVVTRRRVSVDQAAAQAEEKARWAAEGAQMIQEAMQDV